MNRRADAEGGPGLPSASPFGATAALAAAARAMGVSWVGVAPASPLPEDEARLRDWLAQGHHADMAWLAEDPARRADPGRLLPGCRSVVVLALNYLRGGDEPSPDEAPVGLVARYARGRDYHRVLGKIGQRLARMLRAEWVPGCAARPFVDVGPVLERAWAVRAGLGFVGRNSMLIDPQRGSWFVLSVILTTASLEPTPPAAVANGCGDCRRCIDACPTDAIVADGVVDARRCLSYLTIETEGDTIPEPLAARLDGWVFGCDRCQEVCPYNVRRALPAPETSPLQPPIVPGRWPLAELLSVREPWLEAIPYGTPLRRTGVDNLLRNGALVAAERGGEAELRQLRALESDPSRPAWLRDLARRCADRLAGRLAAGAGGKP